MTFHLEKNQLLRGMGLSIITFLLLVIGAGVLLGVSLQLQNVAVYFVFSILAGFIYLILSGYALTIVLFFFMTGLLVGFIEMYRAFWQGLEGWGEIIGILTLLIWPTIGIILGVIIQIGVCIYNKYQNKKTQNTNSNNEN
ncbi:hypothetical protein [Isachenkonia alkalipeptolytica]|uniref:Uncharacterized protein n=1 Tax=Isachenkonia alkalipeptolytica TaxID=2565777 RepID=A0AA43XLJ7_9CLOT|nr:hypothetical protein [Isachenkonia alkalipeptolytica]NBG88474.1 hypothetical protein [Isachenkonia alkalipeptolytica]